MGSIILPPHSKIIGGAAPAVRTYSMYTWVNAGSAADTTNTTGGKSFTTEFNWGVAPIAGDGKLCVVLYNGGDFDDTANPLIGSATLNGVNMTINSSSQPTRNNQGIAYRLFGSSIPSGNDELILNVVSTGFDRLGVEAWYLYFNLDYPSTIPVGSNISGQTLTVFSGTTLTSTTFNLPAGMGYGMFGSAIADDGDETDTWTWSDATEDANWPYSDAIEGWTGSVALGTTVTAPRATRTGASLASGATWGFAFNSTETACSFGNTALSGSDTNVSASGGTFSPTLPTSTSSGDDILIVVEFDTDGNMGLSNFSASVTGGTATVCVVDSNSSRMSLALVHITQTAGSLSSFTITNNHGTAQILTWSAYAFAMTNFHGYYLNRTNFSASGANTGTAGFTYTNNMPTPSTNRAYVIPSVTGTTISGSAPSTWTEAAGSSLSEMDMHVYTKDNMVLNDSTFTAVSFAGTGSGTRTDTLLVW